MPSFVPLCSHQLLDSGYWNTAATCACNSQTNHIEATAMQVMMVHCEGCVLMFASFDASCSTNTSLIFEANRLWK